MRLLAEHGLEDIRYSRKGREIVAVKHAVFGWISPGRYYALQEFRELLPKFIEGGYRIKQALATASIEIAGFGIPIGGPAYAAAIAKGILNVTGDDPKLRELGAIELIGAFLPFGEPLMFIGLALESGLLASSVGGAFGAGGNGIVDAFVWFGKSVFGPIFSLFGNKT